MEHVRTTRIRVAVLKGVFGFCIMGILAVFVRTTFHQEQNYEEQRRDLRLERLYKLQKEDRQKLAGYRWEDKAKGTVHIPIEQAMDLTLADLKAKGVSASSVKAEPNVLNVVPPYVQAAPLPAASPSATAK